ncbi:ribonuclease H-like [Ambystoma mexicanum]|uniref:ribonuclease H-like n=1 Tax=Ambystoma mexicanum TaxID=8296 RepID=UPI0037E95ED7
MQEHDCATYEGEDDNIPKASENALQEGEIYFIDGSASIDPETGEKHVGMAQVRMEEDSYEMIVQKRLPSHFHAQAAELVALIEALHAAKGCSVTIYSDSAYATTTVHSRLSEWRRRGFRQADGSPVQHATLLNELIEALAEPSVVAVMKCQAHTNNTDAISLGNVAADAAAKDAAYFNIPSTIECIANTHYTTSRRRV